MGLISTAHARAPFTWPGGKGRVHREIARALGLPVKAYHEPFAGGLAVLLSVPRAGLLEVVTDTDAQLANVWRALRYQPATVAHWADWPRVESDIMAVRAYLAGLDLAAELADIDWPGDAKAAGLWMWANAMGIGGDSNTAQYSHRGIGVLRPSFGIADAGNTGVTAPGLRDVEAGIARVARRLRDVVILHGPWHRALNLHYGRHGGGTTAVLLDPPYRGYTSEYASAEPVDYDALTAWAISEGAHPRTRIVLCGHVGDYDMPHDWRTHEWDRDPSTGGGTGERECLWLSPACLPFEVQGTLFQEAI